MYSFVQLGQELSDDNDDLNRLAEDNLANTTELDQKLEKIMNKIKFKSFGKVSFSNKVNIDRPLEKLYEDKIIHTSKKSRQSSLSRN